MRSIWGWLGRHRTVRGLALASLVANVGIVVTGGAVRLTASGLGCPTVPSCTEDSLVPTQEMGVHGLIEFGNRQLTFVVGALAGLALLAALAQRPRRRSLVVLAALVLAVIPAQALIGMVTVWTELNPWVVGCHFLVSTAVIAAAYTLWRHTGELASRTGKLTGELASRTGKLSGELASRTGKLSGEADGRVQASVPRPLRQLTWLTTAVAAAVLVAGTVVTGAGPHAGDADAKRNGLDLESVSQVHVDLVFLLLGLSIAAWLAMRASSAPRAAVRAAAVLVGVELGQGLIGFVQYFTDLPVLLVGAHMLGACLMWLAALDLLHHTRVRVAASSPVPADVVVAESAPVGASA